MAIDKIEIVLFFLDQEYESYFKNFFQNTKRFIFSFSKIFDSNILEKNSLVIFPPVFDEKNVTSKLNFFLKNDPKKIVFLIPRLKKKIFENSDIKIIYYPLKIKNFEEQLYKYLSPKYYKYKNIILVDDNLLIVENDKQKALLTETESKIVKCLFSKKRVSKNFLNIEVLNQRNDLESKTLETHLSRLRKKILELNQSIKIFSNKNKEIQIN